MTSKDQYYTKTVRLNSPPPQVDTFKQGTRVCVAVHSLPGEMYKYTEDTGYGAHGVDPYTGGTYYYSERGQTMLSGKGEGQIEDTSIFFFSLDLGE